MDAVERRRGHPDHAIDHAPTAVDPWRLRETGWDPERRALGETLFALANGSLGVRGGFEESRSPSDASFLAAVYERHPIAYHERFPGYAQSTDTRVPVPDGKAITIRLGDEVLDVRTAECIDFERVLDLREGVLRRRMKLRSAAGATVQIDCERMVALDRDVLAIRFRVTSIDYVGPITLVSALDAARSSTAAGDDPRIGSPDSRLATVWGRADEYGASLVQCARRSRIEVACAQVHSVDPRGLTFVRAEVADGRIEQRYSAMLVPGGRVALDKFVAYASGVEAGVAAAAADSLSISAVHEGFDALLERQRALLAAYWRDVAIEIDHDPHAELALRFNLFHVFQSTSRDARHCTAAKGLTGEGYEGHCFWDTEVFVLPVMVFTAPSIAREMLRFRHRLLDAARDNARDMNHPRGALYPWRTIAGRECSSHYPSGSAAYHINAAIAYAIGLYLDATEDTEFLLEAGAEMLFETARIWPQVGHFDARRGGCFGIHCVTGPDEYSALVDNNFYTNRMAQQHLRRAVAVWQQLSASHPHALLALSARLQLDDAEVMEWQRIAALMQLPYDDVSGVYPQDDAFLRRPRWPFAPTPGRPLLLSYHPLTLYRHQICKQADVVMALVLAGDGLEADRKRRSYEFYEAITTHDSTLSAPVFGVLASELGLHENAARYFEEGLYVDLENRHGNTAHGVHMAAMAGSWLSLVWGFGGLRVTAGQLAFAPTLPRGWQRYRWGLHWCGRRLQVEVTREGARYLLVTGAPLPILHHGRPLLLLPGDSGPIALAADPLGGIEPVRFPRRCAALIFDLDGVLTDTADAHYRAWKRLADEIDVDFDAEVNRRLKGVDRMRSLEIILERAPRPYSAAERLALAERKNGYYVEMIAAYGPSDLFHGAERLLARARRAGLRLALASSSRNAPELVRRLGIADAFDHIVDAASVEHPKPAPDIFLAAAHALGVAPADCIGIEDAAAGVAALKKAGMVAIGIGDPAELDQADAVVPSIAAFRLDSFVRRSRRDATQQPTAEKET